MSLKHFAAPLFATMIGALAIPVQAHEIWVERDGAGPARIYLGEPDAALPEGGDPEFEHLQTPKFLPASDAALTRKAGYIEAQVPRGDVRVQDDTVFAPWGPDGKKESVVYYARAGRGEARALLPLEIAPATAGGDRFVLTRDGKPVAEAEIKVISPDKWTKSLKTDAQGGVTVPLREKGRYLLSASQKDQGEFDTPKGKVATLHRIATTTFTVD